MAFRISDQVVKRGWLDCRTKGTVTGELELCGWDEPLTLDLEGYPHRDLAGCYLTFTNPNADLDQQPESDLSPNHHGATGDLTASKKVKVSPLPVHEMLSHAKAGLEIPFVWENVLYLEWFCPGGRFVLEAGGFETKLGAPSWLMTDDEERQAHREADNRLLGMLSATVKSIDFPDVLQWPDAGTDDDEDNSL